MLSSEEYICDKFQVVEFTIGMDMMDYHNIVKMKVIYKKLSISKKDDLLR